MGTASNIAPGLRRSSSANMTAMKSSAVRQSATSLMITKTTAKIEQVISFKFSLISFHLINILCYRPSIGER
jgi:hypothetical protein